MLLIYKLFLKLTFEGTKIFLLLKISQFAELLSN